VEPRFLTVGGGCGALIQQLAFLLCDPADCMLLVTPTYAMLYNDVGVLAGVALILWITVSPHWSWWPEATRSPLHRFLTLVVGTITIVLVGAAVTIASSRRAYTPPGGS
jgi:hypothetical protein